MARVARLEFSILVSSAERCGFPEPQHLDLLTTKPGPLHGARFVDSWGQPLVYNYPALHGTREFDLYSAGANALDEAGGGDDISNWAAFDAMAYRSGIDLFVIMFVVAIFDLPAFLLARLGWRWLRRTNPAA